MYAAEEHLAELMPIFERLRARGEVGNAYPMHMGPRHSNLRMGVISQPNWVMS